jgi:isopentenyl-diphosphate delta-isomerase type 1
MNGARASGERASDARAGASAVAEPADNVVLLDARGAVIGEAPRDSVHSTATPRHLAFSLYLFDDAGDLLITRRALDKRTWPGVWTNTCCGHPRPGEELTAAIRRRLQDELGMGVGELSCVLPDFGYVATDASGIVENESCPVFEGRLEHPYAGVTANPDEVMDWRWVRWDDLARAVRLTPFAFSPWAVRQIDLLSPAANRRRG